jgi:hypothetical protein
MHARCRVHLTLPLLLSLVGEWRSLLLLLLLLLLMAERLHQLTVRM